MFGNLMMFASGVVANFPISDNESLTFWSSVRKSGKDGFGYDPIFEPENAGKTFAEMNLSEKNIVSHRARAFAKMIDFLNQRV